MVKLSRYILVLTGVLVAAVSIPSLYWLVAAKVPPSPVIFYSTVLDDFIIINSSRSEERSTRIDSKGNDLSQADYERVMPLMFFRQLIADGRMPDSINGVPMEPALINRYNYSYRFNPRNFDAPSPALYPLLESQSGRVNLEMPDDYFRMKRGIEFIVARDNKVNIEKSRLFTEALTGEGFRFPATIIAGIPTTRKSKDEGYFVTDSNGKLFHFKMIKGAPFVKLVYTPDGFEIIHIDCVDMRTSEYYAYIYTRSHGIFVLMDEVYDLQRLPVEGFNPYEHSLRVNGDMFNKCISWVGDNWIKAVSLDDMYNVVNEYEENWPALHERTEGKVFSALFPFQIEMKNRNSSFIRFYAKRSSGYIWLITNLVLTALYVAFLQRRRMRIASHVADICIVAITGIYGLISIFVFPNRFRK